MDDVNPPLHESSPLLWLLAIALGLLAGHLALGFTRQAQRQAGPGAAARPLAAAALALGSGVFATMALIMSSQPLAYTVGYRAGWLAGAWALAVVLALVPAALMVWRPVPGSVVWGAATFGLGSTAAQAGMLWAAGLQPGLVWRRDALVLAAAVSALGVAAALWLALIGPGRAGRNRRRWRVLSAALFGLALVAGAELVLVAGDMATQIGSAQAQAFSSRALQLVAAVLVPGLLLALAGLLHLGAPPDEAVAAATAHRRRRRRRRWWAMRP